MKEQNNYKEILTWRKMSKRGQVTVFVIIGIAIVAAGVLIYAFYPEISSVISGEISPNKYLGEKISSDLNSGVELLSKQGGYENPESFILFNGNKVKYLCYTSLYHEPCKVQQPMIKTKFEKELSNILQSKVETYVSEMVGDYERQGYTVTAPENIATNVLIVPGKIIIEVDAVMTFEKDGEVEKFNQFKIEKRSEMYDLLMTSVSIIDYESTYGDSSTDFYATYYPDMIVRKKQSTIDSDTTIYELEEVTTGETFTFASRGLAWGAGYGLE